MKKFILLGKGAISKYHINAIDEIDGELVDIYDPAFDDKRDIRDIFKRDFDYVSICSPSYLHYDHIKLALDYNKKIICEKPITLPWQPLIDDDNINVVLQYNWVDLPEKADKIEVVMVRDEEYFKSWKGNVKFTGGMFPTLFIHYIDLAIKLDATFVGKVISKGQQVRKIDNIDLMKMDTSILYTKMYYDIVYNNKGIKPKDLMYLSWIMNRCGWIYGYSNDIVGKHIEFKPNDLKGLIKI